MSLLKKYMSMENIHELETDNDVVEGDVSVDGGLPVPEVEVPEVQDVTDEEVEQAEELLEDLRESEAEAEAEAVEVERITEEVEVTVEHLDQLHGFFKHGVETKQYSPQFAAYAAAALERYEGVLRAEEVPSFESYNQENLGEYYEKMVAALEDYVRDTTGRSAGLITRKLNELFGKIGTTARTKRLQGIITQVDMLISKVNDLPNETVEVKISGLSGLRRKLSMGGDLPNSILEGIKKERSTLNWIFNDYWKSAVEYHTGIFKVIEESRKIDSPTEMKKLIHQKVPTKTPESKMPNEVTKGTGLFGNVKYTFASNADTDIKSGGMAEFIGVYMVPQSERIDHKTAEKTVKVSKAELLKILTELKANALFMIKNVERISKELGSVVTNSQTHVQTGGEKGWFFLSALHRNRLLNWAALYAWTFVGFIGSITATSISSQKAILQFSKKVEKELRKAGK